MGRQAGMPPRPRFARPVPWPPMISLDEFLDRLFRLAVDRGPRRFPRKTRDRQILTKSILLQLDSARLYDEKEINERLQAWLRDCAPAIETDHVTLRRLLVDRGDLGRTADGGAYRVGFPPGGVLFEREVDDVDVQATVEAFRLHLENQPKRRGPGGDVPRTDT